MSSGGGKGRSVGAAAGGGGHPNGAILNDGDGKRQRRKRFEAWAEGYRDQKLKPNAWTDMYKECPHPIKGGS